MYRLAFVVLLVACGDSSEPVARVEVAQFPAVESRAVDVLLVVDNSNSVDHWQAAFAAALPTLLADLADGAALPDLHIGVITPDLGTTGSLSPSQPAAAVGMVGNGGCAADGDGGRLRTLLVDVADENGGRTRNYDGTLSTALSAAVQLGSTGCGFEQHLHAIRHSLVVNPALWRPDASTAVIALTDEDDCSILDPRFFDPTEATLGPVTSFRCARFGLVCDQPLEAAGDKTNCRPDASSAFVEDPALTKDALDLVHGSARTTFSVIAGPAGPVAVEARQQGSGVGPAIAHLCTSGSTADPSPRLAALADRFASRGHLYSICDASWAPAIASIAKTVERSLGIACLDDALDVDLATCTAHDVRAGLRTELPRCPSTTDCFDILPDSARCGGGLRVTIDRKSTPDATTHVEVACARTP